MHLWQFWPRRLILTWSTLTWHPKWGATCYFLFFCLGGPKLLQLQNLGGNFVVFFLRDRNRNFVKVRERKLLLSHFQYFHGRNTHYFFSIISLIFKLLFLISFISFRESYNYKPLSMKSSSIHLFNHVMTPFWPCLVMWPDHRRRESHT